MAELTCPRCDHEHSRGSSDCPAQRLGTILAGRYRLDTLLGVGGFGAVFKAQHLHLNKSFAVKTLLPRAALNVDFVDRFLREARAAASFDHPGIVQVTDFGTGADGVPFLVMELLEGRSLRAEAKARGRLAVGEVLDVADQMLDAMAVAHAAGIVHRDLKPDNLFYQSRAGKRPRLKILDFGLAKLDLAGEETGLTRSGTFLGSLHYASPEQIKDSASADARSDVYSMGAILYHLLAGTPPIEGDRSMEIMSRVMLGEVERHPRLRRGEIPEWLDAIVARSLAFDREERYLDAGSLRAALDAGRGYPAGSSLPSGESEDISTGVTQVMPSRSTVGLDRQPTAESESVAPPEGEGRFDGKQLRWLLGAALAGLLFWFAVSTMDSTQVPPSAAGDTSAAEAETEAPSSPTRPGKVLLGGTSFVQGIDALELERDFSWCRELAGSSCELAVYERSTPPRQVRVSPFWIDQFEVTNGDFARWLSVEATTLEGERMVSILGKRVLDLHPTFGGIEALAEGGFRAREGWERRPVVQVSWLGARGYCESRGERLPTEAEWELAARGEEGRRFPWGSEEPACGGVSFGGKEGGPCSATAAGPRSVGTSPGDRTAQGVMDLGGSVSEWVADGVSSNYPACIAPCLDPRIPVEGDRRSFRGGNWFEVAEMTRGSGRYQYPVAEVSVTIGFRCSQTAVVDPKEGASPSSS